MDQDECSSSFCASSTGVALVGNSIIAPSLPLGRAARHFILPTLSSKFIRKKVRWLSRAAEGTGEPSASILSCRSVIVTRESCGGFGNSERIDGGSWRRHKVNTKFDGRRRLRGADMTGAGRRERS